MYPSQSTVHDYLLRLAQRCPEKPLLLTETETITAREALARTDALAGWFAAQGLRRGDLVAIRTTRTPGTILMLFGLWALGAVAALADPREPLEDCARTLEAAGTLTDEPGCWVWQPIGGAPVTVTPEGQLPYPLAGDSQAPAMLLFTSGTTGTRKAVVLSQYNAINNLVAAEASGDYRETDIALGILPLNHIFGMVLLLGTVVLGYALFLPGVVEPEYLLRCVERYRLTRMNGVPTLYAAMAKQAANYDLSTLRVGFIGGGPCTKRQFLMIEEALGMTLLSAYGMSECVSITITSWRDSVEERSSSVGRVYPMSRIKILLSDGTEAPTGEEGEICVDAPSKMLGYYRDEAATAELIDGEGFVHTGDLGTIEETGLVRITGRKKEIIIRNGNNLSIRAIEDGVLSVPRVEAAVVAALPHRTEGEVPGLMAVASLSEEALRDALAERLPRNALPETIALVSALPLTATGKPDRQRIRKELEAWNTV